MTPAPIVIAGASVAGVRVAQLLRARGYGEGIVLLDQELGLPYDKPALSKDVLAGKAEAPPTLVSSSELDDLGIQYLPGTAATALDVAERRLALADGRRLPWSRLVLATGATPRRLSLFNGFEGVHCLRTRADAAQLRAAFAGRPSVTVVGGGFIGCEVAAVARQHGLDVTIVEAGQYLVGRGMPPTVGEYLAELHRDHGVDVRTGRTVVAAHGNSHIDGVELDDGSAVAADVVVVGVGVTALTRWLEGSGLRLDDGVVCDEHLAAVGTEDVYAVGDVARWPNPRYGVPERAEHWTSAREQAAVVADNLLQGRGTRTCNLLPYIWSDQFGLLIQHAGRTAGSDRTERHATRSARGALFIHGSDRGTTSVTAFAAPAEFLAIRRQLARTNTAGATSVSAQTSRRSLPCQKSSR